jgi:hypothetical protein
VTKTHRLIGFLISSAGLVAVAGGSRPVHGDDANGLRFEYRPSFAITDLRVARPPAVTAHPSHATYYLADNPDLFYLQVSLLSIGVRPVPLRGETADEWLRALEFELWRDGQELSDEEYAVAAVELTLRRPEFSRDGEVLDEVAFVSRPGRLMAAVETPFDEVRETRTAIVSSPAALAPYEAVELLARVTAADGGPLPSGRYEYRLSYQPPPDPEAWEGNPKLSYFRQLVVTGAPDGPLDVVDGHVVRAAYAKYRGDTEAREAELRSAVQGVPASIKAWRELASFYIEERRLEEAIPCLEEWQRLASAIEAGEGAWEEHADRASATSLAAYLDSLRAEVTAKSAAHALPRR